MRQSPSALAHLPEATQVELQKGPHAPVIPVHLDLKVCPTELVAWVEVWMEWQGSSFDPEGWLPVGAVGPVLQVAHHDPAASFPFPQRLVQPLVVSAATHERLSTALRNNYPKTDRSSIVLPDEGRGAIPYPEPSSHPAVKTAAFFLRGACLPRTWAEHLQKITPNLAEEDWPVEFAEVVTFFTKGVPLIDVRPLQEDPQVRSFLPQNLREQQQIFGLFKEDEVLYLAVPKVPNGSLVDMLYTLCRDGKGQRFKLVLSPSDILGVAVSAQKTQQVVQNIDAASPTRPVSDQTQPDIILDELKLRNLDPRNVGISNEDRLHWILWKAIEANASDIHFEYASGMGRVRLRIDGTLRVLQVVPDIVMRGVIGVAKGGAIPGFTQNTHDTQDARATIRLGDGLINVRANVIPFRRNGMQVMVLRLLKKTSNFLRLDKLGLPARNVRMLRRASQASSGLTLITGPTGSGKTTTLYACLGEINRDDIKINTIEDPVEIELEGATQSMIDEARGVGFEVLMEAILRQDPDVILIGEIRSRETAMLALQASQTGHSVFATLHTNDEIEAVTRLMQFIDDRHQLPVLAQNINLLQAQRLVSKLCPFCSHELPTTPEQKDLFLRNGLGQVESIREPNSEGCPRCYKGFSGRVAIMALLPVIPAIAKLVAQGADSFQIREVATKEGFRTLYQEALVRVKEGAIDLREAEVWRDTWEDFSFDD